MNNLVVLNQIGLLGDAMGTIPLIIDWAKTYQIYLLASTDPSAEQIYNMIPKKYGIKSIWDIPSNGHYEIRKFDLDRAFALSHGEHELHMTQAHYAVFGLPIPPAPIKPELEFDNKDVPIYDYIICPFSRCLPDAQKWQREKWNELISHMPDRQFAIFGNEKYDDPSFINPTDNATYVFSKPLDEVMNLIKKVRYGLISGSTGPSHFAHALGTRNFLFINQGAFAKNPDAIYFSNGLIHDYSVDQVLDTLRNYE
jgi:ADP-heptose:LPS heptosyltransferase